MRVTAARQTLMMCLAIPLLVGMATAADAFAYVCRHDSVRRLECCCAVEKIERGVPAPVGALEEACCCDIVRQPIATSSSPSQAEARDAEDLVWEVATSATRPPLASGQILLRREERTTFPIPLLRQKRSLLL
jgi:hypothetical protein